MTLETTPYVIDGGATHTGEVFRLVPYLALGQGEQGVGGINDLKVSAQTAPDGSVRAADGAAAVVSTYSNSGQETYLARNRGGHNIPVPATTAGSRSDLIVLEIDDPNKGGSAPLPSGPFVRFRRIQGVAAGTVVAPAGYGPNIPLARIDIPPNTTAITNAMIVDLRKLVRPRTKTEWYVMNASGGPFTLTSTSSSSPQRIPSTGPASAPEFDIPAWATHIKFRADIVGVIYPPGNTQGWVGGYVTAGSDVIAIEKNPWNTPNTGEYQNATWVTAAVASIPAALRGRRATFDVRGYLTGSSSNAARPQFDAGTSLIIQVEFLERP